METQTTVDPYEILKQPIQPEDVEWRVQSQTKTGKLIVVPYINNRCVMERFDAAFGWANWSNKIEEINNGFLCTLTVSFGDGHVVSRTDGASKTDIEPVKGGISDAMKRAAVQFGLGRCLYTYPKVFIDHPEKYIPSWATAHLDNLVTSINNNTFNGGDMVTIKNTSGSHSAPAYDIPVEQKPANATPVASSANAGGLLKLIADCQTPAHLNAVTKDNWISKMSEQEKNALWDKAKSFGAKWDKIEKVFK